MRHYCMKCGFSSPYINFLPPDKCAKCGFSAKAIAQKPQVQPQRIYQVPDLNASQIAAISKHRSPPPPKRNPFALDEDDLNGGDSALSEVEMADAGFEVYERDSDQARAEQVIEPEPEKKTKVKRQPPSKVIKQKPAKIKKRKGRKTSEADIQRILSEGAGDSELTY